MNESTPRTAKNAPAQLVVVACTVSEVESGRQVCNKCGFETNSDEIFKLHKKNCPRV